MNRSAIGTLAACVSACALFGGPGADARTKPSLIRSDAPAADWQVYAPAGEVRAENQVATNVPAPFSGASVNELLGADAYYDAGVTGAGVRLASVDAGHIWSGHETLTHVTNFVNAASAWDDPGTVGDQVNDLVDRHATWVGAVAGGRVAGPAPDELQRGIAFGATLESGAVATVWNDDAFSRSFSISGDSYFTPYDAFFGESDVINTSFGAIDPGGVEYFARLGDALANENPSTTFVVAAGNSGPEPNTVISPGSAYNAITVGALTNVANSYTSAADFTSRGPQDWIGGGFICEGCRAPVDIAAPGDRLQAAFYGGQTGGNNPTLADSLATGGPNFYSLDIAGTSFASPITAGAAALVVGGAYSDPQLAGNDASRDARVVKATLLNSAKKTDGWDNGQSVVSGVVETTQSLDYVTGAGALNIGRAYDQHLVAETRDVPGIGAGVLGVVGDVGWDFGQVEAGGSNAYLLAEETPAGSRITVTLAWFRERSQSFLANGAATDVAQADLDLIVRDAISGDIVAWSISAVNVVEHLHFIAPETSTYLIEVDYFGDLFGVQFAEQYGLAWSVAAVPEPSAALLAAFAACVAHASSQRRRMAD